MQIRLMCALGLFLLLAGVGRLDAEEVAAGTVEATGFGGLVAGVGTHGAVGGGIAYAPINRLLVNGEIAYIPGGSAEFSRRGDREFSVETGSRLIDFNAGIHYEILESRRTMPYLAGGVGAVHFSSEVESTVPGNMFRLSSSATNFYANVGAGVRHYLRENWGLRPEVKVFLGEENFVRASVGFFYQFGK